jgi:quercetin dioxygenase-like cupin family protein
MIIDLTKAEKVPFNLDGRIMFKSDKNELIHLTLQPGEELPAHTNPFDVVFYVLEGNGVLSVANDSFKMKQDQTFDVKEGIMRAWKNEGESLLRILVIKILK